MKAMSRAMTAVAAIGLLSVSLAACSNKEDTTANTNSASTPTQATATQTEQSPTADQKVPAGTGSGKLDAKNAEELEAALTGLTLDGMEVKVPVPSAELTRQAKDLAAAMNDSAIKITPEECGLAYESNVSKESAEDIDFLVSGSMVDVESGKMVTVTITRSKSGKVAQQLNNPVLFSGACDDVKVSMGSMGEMAIHSEFSKLDLPNAQTALMQRSTGNQGMSDISTIIAVDGNSMVQVLAPGEYSEDEMKSFATQVLEALTK